jgi:hypothetical protein
VPEAGICGAANKLGGYRPLRLLRSQPYDDVDTGDLIALWRLRALTDEQGTHGDIHEFIFILDEKVMMSRIISIEVGLGRIDGDLA